MCGDLVSNHGTTGRASIEREQRPGHPAPSSPSLGTMSVRWCGVGVPVQTNPTQPTGLRSPSPAPPRLNRPPSFALLLLLFHLLVLILLRRLLLCSSSSSSFSTTLLLLLLLLVLLLPLPLPLLLCHPRPATHCYLPPSFASTYCCTSSSRIRPLASQTTTSSSSRVPKPPLLRRRTRTYTHTYLRVCLIPIDVDVARTFARGPQPRAIARNLNALLR